MVYWCICYKYVCKLWLQNRKSSCSQTSNLGLKWPEWMRTNKDIFHKYFWIFPDSHTCFFPTTGSKKKQWQRRWRGDLHHCESFSQLSQHAHCSHHLTTQTQITPFFFWVILLCSSNYVPRINHFFLPYYTCASHKLHLRMSSRNVHKSLTWASLLDIFFCMKHLLPNCDIPEICFYLFC